MECARTVEKVLSGILLLGGLGYALNQRRDGPAHYGRYTDKSITYFIPARLGWFLQELPSFLVPMFMALTMHGSTHGRMLLLCTFTLHYFHRTFIFSCLVRGRPIPLKTVVSAAIFCSLNGFLQSHSLLHCSDPDLVYSWRTVVGVCLFVLGMIINVHSDHLLMNLRKPGDLTYHIPKGGLFEFVSGANFLGEIVEWVGFAVVAGTLPAFSIAFFTVCSIGPRALGHHRFYLDKFKDYPRHRKAIIPFIL